MAKKPTLTKTGQCYFREADGSLWLAESFVDEKGEAFTQQMQVEPAPETPEQES
jgi:hypothetical protein